MANTPFRFLHSSDFHLERPPSGLSEVSEHLRELFVESPFLAAERVFETALAEKVDFLLLAGDLVDVRAVGPLGIAFLIGQFERLRDRGLPVYWASGSVDAARHWPVAVALPANVHRFVVPQVESTTVERGGVALADILGTARDRRHGIAPAQFSRHPERFSIALAHGPVEPATLRSREIDYWALGGRHNRQTLFAEQGVAHYPGSPQGRGIQESGPHGCTIVDVDSERHARTRFVATDVLRWHNERIELAPEQRLSDLPKLIEQRLAVLANQSPDTDLMIRWTVAHSDSRSATPARHTAAELLESLRTKYGFDPPVRWSLAIDIDDTALLPSLVDEDSILGDFLREVRHYQSDPLAPLEFADLISERRAAGTLGAALRTVDGSTRQRVLEQVAALGIDLLGMAAAQGDLT